MDYPLKCLVLLSIQLTFIIAISTQDQRECNYGDPLNCSAYYQCVGKVVVHKLCPNGLQWNSEMNFCDTNVQCQENMATINNHLNNLDVDYSQDSNEIVSNGKPPVKPVVKPPTKPPVRPPVITTTITPAGPPVITTTIRPSHSTTAAPSKYICPNRNPSSKFYPHPNCNHFYEEIGKFLFDRMCSGSRRWNKNENCCDYSDGSECVYNASLYQPGAITESSKSAQLKICYKCYLFIVVFSVVFQGTLFN